MPIAALILRSLFTFFPYKSLSGVPKAANSPTSPHATHSAHPQEEQFGSCLNLPQRKGHRVI
jgi:hypothetical protein